MKSIIYLFLLDEHEKGPIKHVNAVIKYFSGNVDVISNLSERIIFNSHDYFRITGSFVKNIIVKQFLIIVALRKFLRMANYNYILIRHSIGLFFPFLYLKVRRKKIILEVNGLLFQDLKDRNKSPIIRYLDFIVEFFVYRLVDKVVLVHENLKKPIMVRFKLKEHLFVIIENGVELIPFRSLVLSKKDVNFDVKKIYIGYLGSLAHREGVDLLISHFAFLDAKFYLVIIGGNQKEFKRLSSNIKKEVQDRIIYFPYLPYNSAIKYIQACDINVHLRRPLTGNIDSQGSPLKMLDYLNLNRPVVASRISSYNFIERNSFGVLINPYSFEQFSDAIDAILRDYEKYDNMNAHSYIKKYHNWAKNIKILDSITF